MISVLLFSLLYIQPAHFQETTESEADEIRRASANPFQSVKLAKPTSHYVNLPEFKDFNSEKFAKSMEDALKEYIKLLESEKSCWESKVNDFSMMGIKLEYFQKHPYFQESTDIDLKWFSQVIQSVKYFETLKKSQNFQTQQKNKVELKKIKNKMESYRVQLVAAIKEPKRVEKKKEKKNNH